MLFRIPIPISTSHFPLSHRFCLRPPSLAASIKTGPSWLLRSFRRHKRVRVVCGAAVEEDRRQIQSSTLPKRTSGTLTRQHYSTASIHSTSSSPPPLPLTVDTAHAAAVTTAAPLTPLALHTSASPTAPHCYGYRAKTVRLLPESILKHEKVTLLLFLPPLAPHSFAIPQRIDSHPPSIVYTTKSAVPPLPPPHSIPGSVHCGFVGPRVTCDQIKSWKLPPALRG